MANLEKTNFVKSIFTLIVSIVFIVRSVNSVDFNKFSDGVQMGESDRSIDLLELENMLNNLNRVQRSSDDMESGRSMNFSNIEQDVLLYVKDFVDLEKGHTDPGHTILRESETARGVENSSRGEARASDDAFFKQVTDYVQKHVLNTKISETGRLFFKVFGLKKLMFPLFIGAQILKSVVLAMFLPSILGSIGKIVGKGVSSLSSLSQSTANENQIVEDLDFKVNAPTAQDSDTISLMQLQQGYGSPASEYGYPQAMGDLQSQNLYPAQTYVNANGDKNQQAISRFGAGYQGSEDMYMNRKPQSQDNYKLFHDIPASSQLLASYDPFYSPLLSRLDAVFQQLGLDNTEACRERTICLMYANPAKYAPYSNLVSAQLSRELNELRKPTTNNTEILRFFKYMKAAKDGQDGEDCVQAHPDCTMLPEDGSSPAMITTFNDINKLVQARYLRFT
ncbi:uncharacterized protein LOC113378719 isoform X1 [Ctenocephalides felis]|uniref:uncharacterized protein LOC113378719 isoform X1 n=1 Tax=Ctenocephalides felis TaxID=7515 RepID=UPI000E6E1713|nr:uncharacterized protein LOC113378719 isoform X1 [Ctenocephalides felis]XP_026475070.1 uncharacterized protein LOC113378719 isoform X1 [Ctenocephalides felis]